MTQRDFTDEPLSSLYSLDGRVAVITGAARGIGFATARRLREAGATRGHLSLDRRARADRRGMGRGREPQPACGLHRGAGSGAGDERGRHRRCDRQHRILECPPGARFGLRTLRLHQACGPRADESLAVEFGPYGIRVVAVSPQLTRTEGVTQMSGPFVETGIQEFIDEYAARSPLGRIGMPDDIARTILFAVSDLAGYITGSELMADGGALAFG